MAKERKPKRATKRKPKRASTRSTKPPPTEAAAVATPTEAADTPTIRTEAIRCPRCGSPRRKRYHRTDRRPFTGRSPITRAICSAIIRRWTHCSDCGQVRIEKTYGVAVQGEGEDAVAQAVEAQAAEDMAVLERSRNTATAAGNDLAAVDRRIAEDESAESDDSKAV